MKRTGLVIIFLLSGGLLMAQSGKREKQLPCSTVLKELTLDWKNDSMGTTGYRLQHFDSLRESRPDSISKTILFSHLGSPNLVWKTAFGKPWRNHVEYVYFIWHVDPAARNQPFVGSYIAFVFDEGGNHLEEIQSGEFCQ